MRSNRRTHPAAGWRRARLRREKRRETGRRKRRVEEQMPALISLNADEARTAAAVFERLFPANEDGPGATQIGVLAYVDRALAGAYHDKVEAYRVGLAAPGRARRAGAGGARGGA